MSRRDKRAAYAAAAKPETWLRQKTKKKGSRNSLLYCKIIQLFLHRVLLRGEWSEQALLIG